MKAIIPTTRSRASSGWQRAAVVFAGMLFLVAMLCGAVALQRVSTNTAAGRNLDADHIYQLTNVWTVHLKFTPDQWEAMEPKGGFNPFGGGPNRGGPGRGPGGDTGVRSLTPAIMSLADLNRDRRISSGEFSKLAESWFQAWDTNDSGRLNEAQMRAGLDAVRNPAGGGMAGMLLAPEGKRNGISGAMGIDFEYVRADLEFANRLVPDVGVRYKGNGTFMESRDSLKRSLKIDLNHFAKGQSLDGVTTLTLQNNVTDASLMNEVLAYRLYRDAGVPAPRTAYAKVFVSVPGKYERKYFGLYSLTEAVDKRFAERHFGTKRGAIFKPVTPSLFTDLGADWAAYNQIYSPKTALYDEQKKAVMDLARFVTTSDDAVFAARIGEFIDLPEFARYAAVMVYLSDLDGILGPGQNLFLYLHPKNQQFRFIPWDQDHSWGQFNRASQEQRDQLSVLHPWQGQNYFLERMFRVEAFKKLYLARLAEFSKSIFSPERLAQQVDEIAAAIRPAVQEESESKLARFDKVVAGELLSSPGPFGGGQLKPIKPFTKVRTESIRDQLAGKSQGLSPASGFSFGPGRGGGDGLGQFTESVMKALDADQDKSVTRAEFTDGFRQLFQEWTGPQSGSLTLAQVREGVAKDLPPTSPRFPGFGGGPGGRGGPPRGPGRGGSGGGSAPTIAGTKDPGLFMSEHWGMSAFSHQIPNGKYLAKLYFAETYDGISGSGQRVFSFEVQGHKFKDFDVWAKAGGPRRAYIETVPVDVTNGEFRILFTAQVESPAIKAIEVIPQEGATAGAAAAATTIRIKAGGSAPFTDSSGQVWQPDTGFEGGMTSQVSSAPAGGFGFPGDRPPGGQAPPANWPPGRPGSPNPEPRPLNPRQP